MKCYECGGKYQEKSGQLHLVDECVGRYTVDSVKYYRCSGCGEYMFPPRTASAIERERKKVLDGLVQAQPLSAFLTAAETADLLGISRQALHKHRRIRRGFIYQAKFGDKTVYLKESARRFMEKGDGRFPLHKPTQVEVPQEVNYVSVVEAPYSVCEGESPLESPSQWSIGSTSQTSQPPPIDLERKIA
jgi:hypothetical protein